MVSAGASSKPTFQHRCPYNTSRALEKFVPAIERHEVSPLIGALDGSYVQDIVYMQILQGDIAARRSGRGKKRHFPLLA